MACLRPAFHELTIRKEVSAASMSRASASPWPNALNDADANIVQKHLLEIKRDVNWTGSRPPIAEVTAPKQVRSVPLSTVIFGVFSLTPP